MYGPCGTCISKANTAGTTYEVQRLMGETQRLKRVNANLAETHRRNRDRIAERDATIERLTAQLNEATNVPAVKRCLACNDPHCTAGKP
jgi:DNA repair exonuclease SbcCD ATPase subunit